MIQIKPVRPANDNGSSHEEALSVLLPLIDVLARQAVRTAKAANDNRRPVGSSDQD